MTVCFYACKSDKLNLDTVLYVNSGRPKKGFGRVRLFQNQCHPFLTLVALVVPFICFGYILTISLVWVDRHKMSSKMLYMFLQWIHRFEFVCGGREGGLREWKGVEWRVMVGGEGSFNIKGRYFTDERQRTYKIA